MIEELTTDDACGFRVFQVGAEVGGDAFLILADDASMLVDTGFAYCAPQTYANIVEVMGARPVDLLVLTHSHYDHASAAGYLKERMPSMQVVAHERVARTFSRPGAIATMNELNATQARLRGFEEFENVSTGLTVDRTVSDGDTLQMGSLVFTVLEAPGHTRDSIALWCADMRFLVSCETMGVYGGPMPDGFPARGAGHVGMVVAPTYLVSTKTSLAFVERVRALDPRVLLMPHHRELFFGDESRALIDAALWWGRYVRDFILDAHALGQTDEQVCARVKQLLYRGDVAVIQPEAAFDINTSITVPMVIAEATADRC